MINLFKKNDIILNFENWRSVKPNVISEKQPQFQNEHKKFLNASLKFVVLRFREESLLFKRQQK